METDLEPQSPALKKETDRTPFILTWTPPSDFLSPTQPRHNLNSTESHWPQPCTHFWPQLGWVSR